MKPLLIGNIRFYMGLHIFRSLICHGDDSVYCNYKKILNKVLFRDLSSFSIFVS